MRNLQALRFLAALAVICFHCTYIFYDTPVIQRPLGWLHFTGLAGLDVFFVISGFIIFTVSARIDWSPPPAGVAAVFFARRLVRVYPIYWVYFLIFSALALAGVAEPFHAPWNLDNWGYNAFLLSTYNRQVPVAWTLAYEMFFYLCFSIALLFGRANYRVALAVWLAAELVIATANHFMPETMLSGKWRWQVWSNPIVLEFAIGCFVAFLVQRGHVGYRFLAGLLAIPFFIAGGYWTAHAGSGFGAADYRVITFGIGAGLLVYSPLHTGDRRKFYRALLDGAARRRLVFALSVPGAAAVHRALCALPSQLGPAPVGHSRCPARDHRSILLSLISYRPPRN